jgi:AraC family transcriptional regulator of adaptative response/methylated-DNA-[protein]-cysteine methyltransferase
MHNIIEIPAAARVTISGLLFGQAMTPVGVAWLTWDEVGLRQLAFGESPTDPDPQLLGASSVSRDDQQASHLAAAVFKRHRLDMPLVLCGTDFQRAVWRALLQVRWGQTLSYGKLATRLGRPAAARAVGAAVGANRLGFCVPCHRVVRQDGQTGEFRWGRDVKQRLLDWEMRLSHG